MKLRNGILTAVVCGLLAALFGAGQAGAVVVRLPNGHFLGIAPRHGVSPTSLRGAVIGKRSATNTADNGSLDYNGGPVLHSSAPYLIFWDPPSDPISTASKNLFERYFTNVAADSGKATDVYAVDRQYYDGSGIADYKQTFSSAQVIDDPELFPPQDLVNCPDTAPTYSNCLTDGQIQAEIHRLITADGLTGGLGPNAPIYFVITPGDTNICSDSADCTDNSFCAYHSEFGSNVLYAPIPLFFNGASSAQNPKACQADGNPDVQEPNGDPADVAIKFLSHEDNETITDPTGQAWWDDSSGNEDGDNCNFYGSYDPPSGANPDAFSPTLGGSASGGTLYNQLINGDHYYIQSEWSNGDLNCDMQPAAGSITARISAPPSASPGTAVTLDPTASTSTEGYTSEAWDFGDGTTDFSTGTPSQATHTFATGGVYTVKLTLVDTLGNLSTTTKTIQIGSLPSPSFSYSPTAPVAHSPISFNAAGTTDPHSGTTISYVWDFGDGTTGTGVDPTHIYASPGNYTVTLTTADGLGYSNSTSHIVSVASDEAPTAAFIVQSHHPQAGVPVSFSGSASRDPDGAIAAYAWNFGDGSAPAVGGAPQHVYSRKGSYTVTLTLRDSSGQYAVSSQTVKILAPVITTAYKHGILRVTVQEAGTITIGSKHKSRSRPGTVKFKLRLSHHQQTLLRSRHSLKLKLKIAFAPTLAHATSETVVVKLKR